MNLNNLTPGVGEPPWQNAAGAKPVRNKCSISPYQITHFQVGVGASAVEETSAVVSLGSPLSLDQYGGQKRSVLVSKAMLYLKENVPLAQQYFVTIDNQGQLGTSSLVSVVFLDEDTANGQILNEAGLFVDNPFLQTAEDDVTVDGFSVAFPTLLGGPGRPERDTPIKTNRESPGHLLAAYRHFTPVHKEAYFSLLIRWSINFSIPRV